jgi:uncharacterized protein YndB with AHSA1/START domain
MNKDLGGFQVTTPSDREIAMERTFEAPRVLVFQALSKPEFVRRWLLGPDGWEMTVCNIDLRVGGSYRYEWRHADGSEMAMGGIYREVLPPERLVTTEKFDESWYPGEAVGTMVLVENEGRTRLTLTVMYDNKEARDFVLKTPMEEGVAAGYDRLAKLLAEG